MKDRSELSDLYPKVHDRTDNMNHKEKFRTISRNDVTKNPDTYALFPIVAILMTIPVALFVTLINLLNENLNSGSYDVLMPVLITGLGLWIALSAIFFSLITKRLQKIGVENSLFLVIYSLSGLPLSQFVYNIFRHQNTSVNFFIYAFYLFFVNLIVVTAIMTTMKTKQLSTNVKYALFISLAVFSFLFTLSNNK